MNQYDIRAEIKFKINWCNPAKSPREIILRDMAQTRLDAKASAMEDAFKELLEITTMAEISNE